MRLYGIIRNYYVIENRYPSEKSTIVIFGRRLIRPTLYSAPMTIFSVGTNFFKGPKKMRYFGSEERTCLGYVKSYSFHGNPLYDFA